MVEPPVLVRMIGVRVLGAKPGGRYDRESSVVRALRADRRGAHRDRGFARPHQERARDHRLPLLQRFALGHVCDLVQTANRIGGYCDMGYDVDRAFSEVFAEYGLRYELR